MLYKVKNVHKTALGTPHFFLRPGQSSIVDEELVCDGARTFEKKGWLEITESTRRELLEKNKGPRKDSKPKENVVTPEPEVNNEKPDPSPAVKEVEIPKIIQDPEGQPAVAKVPTEPPAEETKEEDSTEESPAPEAPEGMEKDVSEEPAAKVWTRDELESMKAAELREITDEYGFKAKKKDELVNFILEKQLEEDSD